MSGLTSTAKSVKQQRPQVVYVPAPTPTAPSAPPVPTPEEEAAEQRRKSLLSRDRGRFGTVKTGFRGLLDLAASGIRKTLLGE